MDASVPGRPRNEETGGSASGGWVDDTTGGGKQHGRRAVLLLSARQQPGRVGGRLATGGDGAPIALSRFSPLRLQAPAAAQPGTLFTNNHVLHCSASRFWGSTRALMWPLMHSLGAVDTLRPRRRSCRKVYTRTTTSLLTYQRYRSSVIEEVANASFRRRLNGG